MKYTIILVATFIAFISCATTESKGNILSSNKFLVDQTQIPLVTTTPTTTLTSQIPLTTSTVSQIPLTTSTVSQVPTITQIPSVLTQTPYYIDQYYTTATTNPYYYSNYYYPQMYTTPVTTASVTQIPIGTTTTTKIADPTAKYVIDTGLNPTGPVKIIQ